jgi:Coenzyme PQQ synthesis protein D (PqqD)
VSLGKQPVEGRVRSSSKVVSRVVADEALVVPIRGGTGDLNSIYSFNAAGTKLWALIESGQSAAELAQYLEDVYGLDAYQARSDAESFLRELADEGLIEQE